MGDPIPDDLQPPFLNGMALDAVKLINSMDTQWNYIQTGFGSVKKGLDYSALEVVARFKNIELYDDLFEVIRKLEMKIIKILGDKNGSS